jgi:SAM-dependent methyltransferase
MLKHTYKRVINKLRLRGRVKPEGEEGIRQLGHRQYVGGMWEEIGRLQYEYILAQGLKPEHVLLDIACGSLRSGVHFINYLGPGNYMGVEKEVELIRLGIEQELGAEVNAAKKPEFLISDSFEFGKLSKRPDYALAQSLFTHLPPALIDLCCANLRQVIRPDGVFYATYHEVKKARKNPDVPHTHGFFAYTRAQMKDFGSRNGWLAEYIGDWGHPRHQVMVRYRPAKD